MKSRAQSFNNGSGIFKDDIFAAHNKYRAELDITPLMWSNELTTHAQAWTDHLASMEGATFEHSTQDAEGENLWL
jgi:uncharacterized protein YkwD